MSEEHGIHYARKPVVGMRQFQYTRLHITSRTLTEATVWCNNRADFLELVNWWNHNDQWHYCGRVSVIL